MNVLKSITASVKRAFGRMRPSAERFAAGCLRLMRRRSFAAVMMVLLVGGLLTLLSTKLRVVTVVDGNSSRAVLTLHSDPYTVLATAGVSLGSGDTLAANETENFGTLEISRAFNVYVTAAGTTSAVRMTGGTVSDALARLGIVPEGDDVVQPAVNANLFEDIDITVQRVQYEEFTKTESIPFTTTYKETIVIKEGVKKTKQAGRAGVRTATYRNRIVDGEVVETVLVKEEVTRKAVNAIVLVGMKAGTPLSKVPFDLKLDANGQPVKYKKMYTGICTAYSGEEGWYGQHTATGMKPRVGVVAVDPKLIPYGTKLYITSADGKYVYGYAIAGDTGSGVENHTLIADLYMDTIRECNLHGKRKMNVYVIG